MLLSSCARTPSHEPSTTGSKITAGPWVLPRWDQLGEIEYLLPSKLPPGWKLKTATERPGRPQKEWQEHDEILTTKLHDRFLFLEIHRLDTSDQADVSLQSKPGKVDDVPQEEVIYLLAYVVGQTTNGAPDPTAMNARGVEWRNSRFGYKVIELAKPPDDQLIERVADRFKGIDQLAFDVRKDILDEGFEVVGRAAGLSGEVTDYTVSWAPPDLVGQNRQAAVALPDTGPTIFISVGCRFYGQGFRNLSTDAGTAQVTRSSGVLRMEFLTNGSSVSVGARGVDEQTIRAFATSLQLVSRQDWVAQLGDRLLVDTSSQSR